MDWLAGVWFGAYAWRAGGKMSLIKIALLRVSYQPNP
jgi:hypothetical protein